MSVEVNWDEYALVEIPTRGKKPAKAQLRRRWFWMIFGASMFAILLLALPSPPSRILPLELIGKWRTTDQRYGDRYIEIDPVSISFGTGDATLMNGFIRQVEIFPEGIRTLYTISYADNGEEGQCSFYYSEEKGKTIYLENQPEIAWVKDKDN